MKIAVIPPHDMLDEYGTMGDEYHLCLSAEVLSNPDYADFYYKRRALGDYVILDNSAHEQLEGQTIEQLARAIAEIAPTEIVLPDRLFFGDDTVERSIRASSIFRRDFPNVKQMGVPQGRLYREWFGCLLELKQIGVDSIGISKDYEVWDGGLRRLVDTVRSVGFQPEQIHLLGWRRELWQLAPLYDEVRGVDSAKPVVYALNGITLPDEITDQNAPAYPRRKTDYFSTSLAGLTEFVEFDQRVHHNIRIFRLHARGERGRVHNHQVRREGLPA